MNISLAIRIIKLLKQAGGSKKIAQIAKKLGKSKSSLIKSAMSKKSKIPLKARKKVSKLKKEIKSVKAFKREMGQYGGFGKQEAKSHKAYLKELRDKAEKTIYRHSGKRVKVNRPPHRKKSKREKRTCYGVYI